MVPAVDDLEEPRARLLLRDAFEPLEAVVEAHAHDDAVAHLLALDHVHVGDAGEVAEQVAAAVGLAAGLALAHVDGGARRHRRTVTRPAPSPRASGDGSEVGGPSGSAVLEEELELERAVVLDREHHLARGLATP